MSRIAGAAKQLATMLRRDPWAPLLTASLLGLTLFNLPIVPSSSEVDLSLIDVLNFAHQHDLQFGPQITSTFGPLGWLYFPYYSQHSGMLQLLSQLALSLVALAGCCLIAWRLTLFWRCLLLCGFTWAAANMAYRADLLVDVGLLCWGLFCLVVRGRRLAAALVVLAIFSAFASLTKISFLFIAILGIAYIAADLLLRGERNSALNLLVGYIVSLFAGWIFSGQNPGHFGRFLAHALITVQSYNQALGLEGLAALRFIAFVLWMLLVILAAMRCRNAFHASGAHVATRRALLFVWLFLFTLASWKHGFIRLDVFHAPLFLGFSVVLALATDVLSTEANLLRRSSRALAIICVLISAALLQQFLFSPVLRSLVQPLRECQSHFNCLFHPLRYKTEMERLRAGIHEEYQLPDFRKIVGGSPVDVFGQYQSFAIDNDLNFKPRPVFQSYNVCNRALNALNQNFYLSTDAPRFVLFDLKAMDDKLPPLEDAVVLRHLLINYKPIAEEKRFVLLQAKSAEFCNLTLLREDRAQFGEQIDLQKYGNAPLWLEMDLRPSFRGWLRQLLYASPVLRLSAWSDPGKTLLVTRRAPSSMLAAGFLANPLLLRTSDIQDLFAGKSLAHPAGYSVRAAPGQESLWHDAIRFRIYKIENAIGAQRKETNQLAAVAREEFSGRFAFVTTKACRSGLQ